VYKFFIIATVANARPRAAWVPLRAEKYLL